MSDIRDDKLKSLCHELGVEIANFQMYEDGFSFTTPTELEAYKAAYKYQGVKRVVVKKAPNINAWTVQIYTRE